MIAFTNILHRIAKAFAVISLAVMMLMTFADVTLRYTINAPILGSNEMTEFLLGVLVFAGLIIVQGERSHIVVTLFEAPLLKTIPSFYRWTGITTNLVGVIGLAILITRYTFILYDNGNETEIWLWEWWWLGTLVSVFCIFAVFMGIRSISAPLLPMANDAEAQTEIRPGAETGL